ncbi:MAG: LacI family DNA-binding transcriptional regulator [Verrucomicrobia bacterium]|nr:LacI family DNA-binding transcriptional regulator [Verrucomicrobiota bacterium]
MTLHDLAKKLNVSTATISRALTRPETVSRATRDRVINAVSEFGYRPNAIARSLRTKQTRTIGLVVSDITNWFFGTIVKAIEDVARSRRYSVIVCNANEDPENEEIALRLFWERSVSGIINCSSGASPELLKSILQAQIPIVDLDRKSGLTNVDSVTANNTEAAFQAARHLLCLGHTKIGMIAGPLHLSTARERLAGFYNALRAEAIVQRRDYVQIGNFRNRGGYAAAKQILNLPDPPTALLVANSEMLAGALHAFRESKIAIPQDMSVVNFDDDKWLPYLDPPFTVIAQPTEVMGRRAIELLLRQLENPGPTVAEVFNCQLIVRSSTAPPPIRNA